jgi:SsrA-binding protein
MIVNRRIKFDYKIIQKWEAGIVLLGTEASVLRRGMGSIMHSYATIDNEEVFLLNMHIPKSKFSYMNHDELRRRKLLLHKKEIKKMMRVSERQLTLIPETIYENKRGYFKVTIALCEGKKKFDKRRTIREKENRRDL